MRSEFNGPDDRALEKRLLRLQRQGEAGREARPNKLKTRLTRSRVAKPLLTSLGTITLLAGSSFVVIATSSTGSLKPWDWTSANPSAAVSRYEACGQQSHGLGVIGCMMSAGFRPALAGAPANGHRAQPLFSVATVQDPVPADTPGAKAGSKPAARRSSMPSASSKTQLVHLPSNPTWEDVSTACQTAMKTAQRQGSPAMKEVADECEADYSLYCKPAIKTPTGQGMVAIEEMEDECKASTQPNSSLGHDD